MLTHRRLPDPSLPQPDPVRLISNNGAQPRAAEEIDRFATWHCPNCGRVEAPQDCLGIRVRRPVEMVPAADYDEARAKYEAAHRQLAELSTVLRHLAWVTPRAGKWERTERTLHDQALAALART